MKIKAKKELHLKTVAELKKFLEEAKKAVMQLKLDHQQNKLKSTRDIFNKRKEVAILKSILTIKNKMEIVKEEVKEVVKKAKGGK